MLPNTRLFKTPDSFTPVQPDATPTHVDPLEPINNPSTARATPDCFPRMPVNVRLSKRQRFFHHTEDDAVPLSLQSSERLHQFGGYTNPIAIPPPIPMSLISHVAQPSASLLTSQKGKRKLSQVDPSHTRSLQNKPRATGLGIDRTTAPVGVQSPTHFTQQSSRFSKAKKGKNKLPSQATVLASYSMTSSVTSLSL